MVKINFSLLFILLLIPNIICAQTLEEIKNNYTQPSVEVELKANKYVKNWLEIHSDSIEIPHKVKIEKLAYFQGEFTYRELEIFLDTCTSPTLTQINNILETTSIYKIPVEYRNTKSKEFQKLYFYFSWHGNFVHSECYSGKTLSELERKIFLVEELWNFNKYGFYKLKHSDDEDLYKYEYQIKDHLLNPPLKASYILKCFENPDNIYSDSTNKEAFIWTYKKYNLKLKILGDNVIGYSDYNYGNNIFFDSAQIAYEYKLFSDLIIGFCYVLEKDYCSFINISNKSKNKFAGRERSLFQVLNQNGNWYDIKFERFPEIEIINNTPTPIYDGWSTDSICLNPVVNNIDTFRVYKYFFSPTEYKKIENEELDDFYKSDYILSGNIIIENKPYADTTFVLSITEGFLEKQFLVKTDNKGAYKFYGNKYPPLCGTGINWAEVKYYNDKMKFEISINGHSFSKIFNRDSLDFNRPQMLNIEIKTN